MISVEFFKLRCSSTPEPVPVHKISEVIISSELRYAGRLLTFNIIYSSGNGQSRSICTFVYTMELNQLTAHLEQCSFALRGRICAHILPDVITSPHSYDMMSAFCACQTG